MIGSAARIETPNASKYLAGLCKRLARRCPARLQGDEGRIDLPFGPCHISALPGSLALVVEADDEQRLNHLEWMVANHLKRVAAREFLDVAWTRTW